MLTDAIEVIDREITRLTRAKELLTDSEYGSREVSADPVVRKAYTKAAVKATGQKRVLSPEARERIALAQKKRWAAQKKAAK